MYLRYNTQYYGAHLILDLIFARTETELEVKTATKYEQASGSVIYAKVNILDHSST